MKPSQIILLLPGLLLSFNSNGNHVKQYADTRDVSCKITFSDDTSRNNSLDSCKVVSIPGSKEGEVEKATYFKTKDSYKRPLLVSLHTWSGDYRQADPLAKFAIQDGWNYIHPDFQGPNFNKNACLSQKALSDIDNAIQFAIEQGGVDKENIFVVGVSGGGYATIGTYMKSKYPVKAFLAWAPITDLVSWYWQSVNRNSNYAKDILKCTSEGDSLNIQAARNRSPFYWDIPADQNAIIEIYAGINDGYNGSVPITHTLQFFNKLVENRHDMKNIITESEIVCLLSRGIPRKPGAREIGNRDILFTRKSGNVRIIIFDGSHEMLPEYCFGRIKKIAEQTFLPER